MGDVQITIQQGSKSVKVNVLANTQFMGNNGNLQTAKKGAVIKMTKEQYQAFVKIAGQDGKADLSGNDLKKFNSLGKAKQTEMINQAMKSGGSKYKVGKITDGEDEGSISTSSKSASINLTPDGKKLLESDKNAKFFGVYIQGK